MFSLFDNGLARNYNLLICLTRTYPLSSFINVNAQIAIRY